MRKGCETAQEGSIACENFQDLRRQFTNGSHVDTATQDDLHMSHWISRCDNSSLKRLDLETVLTLSLPWAEQAGARPGKQPQECSFYHPGRGLIRGP